MANLPSDLRTFAAQPLFEPLLRNQLIWRTFASQRCCPANAPTFEKLRNARSGHAVAAKRQIKWRTCEARKLNGSAARPLTRLRSKNCFARTACLSAAPRPLFAAQPLESGVRSQIKPPLFLRTFLKRSLEFASQRAQRARVRTHAVGESGRPRSGSEGRAAGPKEWA
jgi:hypothetical protein